MRASTWPRTSGAASPWLSVPPADKSGCARAVRNANTLFVRDDRRLRAGVQRAALLLWDNQLLAMIGLYPLHAAYSAATPSAPIIGGWGAFRYQYMPDLMKLPAGANAVNCHGLVTDSAANI